MTEPHMQPTGKARGGRPKEKKFIYSYDVPNQSHYPAGVSGNLMGSNRLRTDADKVKALRTAVVGLIRVGGAQFARDIQTLKSKDRLKILLELLRFVLPKPRPLPPGDEDEADAQESVADLLAEVAGQNARAREILSRSGEETGAEDEEEDEPATIDRTADILREFYAQGDED